MTDVCQIVTIILCWIYTLFENQRKGMAIL